MNIPDADICDAAASPTAILSTADQIAQECLSADVFAQPVFQAAIDALRPVPAGEAVAYRPPGDDVWRRSVAELAFAYIQKTLNLLAFPSRSLWDQNMPHRRGDRIIPGSRSYGPNPDNLYRRIPVDPAGRYRLRGRRPPHPGNVTFTVMPDYRQELTWKAPALDVADLDIDADGWFEFTLDAGDGGGKTAHMVLPPGAQRLTVRDSLSDWENETPIQIELTRLDRDDAAAAVDPAAMAAGLAPGLAGYVAFHIGVTDRFIFSRAPNDIAPPRVGGGYLSTQAITSGSFSVNDDSALVVTTDAAGAEYLGLQVIDPWGYPMNYREQNGSLNAVQAVADTDGLFRFVIACRDPGLHNWIDTDGAREGGLVIRWQGLPGGRDDVAGWMAAELVRQDDLRSLLPAETRWIAPDARARLGDARRRAHDRRFFL